MLLAVTSGGKDSLMGLGYGGLLRGMGVEHLSVPCHTVLLSLSLRMGTAESQC